MIRQTMIWLVASLLFGCHEKKETPQQMNADTVQGHKKVIYQVFPRLFGNTETTNKPWGTLEENGTGKFSDFTDKALQEIKDLGVTHIWYTGVPHHALVTDYTSYGISADDPDVVKGRAGSPYAVKDYYNVNPDLADEVENRFQEFKALIDRTHRAGLKLLIDIVPNHVARNYEGSSTPSASLPFGTEDDRTVAYARDNNFYYIPGSAFEVPEWEGGYRPLGGAQHELADRTFVEEPAKWTGNGARDAQPNMNDWYETVKVNYGVRPDGSYDFERLPASYDQVDHKGHYDFWQDKKVPDSWVKFKDIALFWLDQGIDGFRYDMAEMVPVEFWSYMNSHIKVRNNEALLLAEVYQPALYRDYIRKGKMDYLYDKVELYDNLKHIMQGHGWTDHIPKVLEGLQDIEHHMLHFLENHDEQRIASPEFAGDARKGMPAMVVSATSTTSPTMIYFGQEVGEPAAENAGYGQPSRTSIFDYIGVPHHQRWVNNKKYDGGQLSEDEKRLRDFYQRLLSFTISSKALMGAYRDIHYFNKDHTEGYDHKVLSYVRWNGAERLIVTANFHDSDSRVFELKVPREMIETWNLDDGAHGVFDALYGSEHEMTVENGVGRLNVHLNPLESFIFVLK